MDGSVSTLAPSFAAAFATHNSWATFLIGLATSVGAGISTLPYLIPNVKTATSIVVCVVLVELGVMSWVRHKFMDTPLVSAVLQVVLGGALVFLAGILIGNS